MGRQSRKVKERGEERERAGRAAVSLFNLLTSSLHFRRVRTAWFQYLITLAPYCFEWWEQLIVHALVVAAMAGAFYLCVLIVRGAGLVLARAGA